MSKASKQPMTLRRRAEWAETDPHAYLENATKILGDLQLEVDLDSRCHQIEKALLEAVSFSVDQSKICPSSRRTFDTDLQNLIQQRVVFGTQVKHQVHGDARGHGGCWRCRRGEEVKSLPLIVGR